MFISIISDLGNKNSYIGSHHLSPILDYLRLPQVRGNFLHLITLHMVFSVQVVYSYIDVKVTFSESIKSIYYSVTIEEYNSSSYIYELL